MQDMQPLFIPFSDIDLISEASSLSLESTVAVIRAYLHRYGTEEGVLLLVP